MSDYQNVPAASAGWNVENSSHTETSLAFHPAEAAGLQLGPYFYRHPATDGATNHNKAVVLCCTDPRLNSLYGVPIPDGIIRP